MIPYLTGMALAGTLVVVIPSREGLVVVADSRSTVLGRHFDGNEKLHVARTKLPILVTVTGTSDFADAPPAGISVDEWMPKATYQYRGAPFVQSYLEKQPDTRLSAAMASKVAEALALSLNEYFNTRPSVRQRFLGHDLCRVALGQVVETGSMLFASIALTVDDHGRISSGIPTFKEYRTSDPKTMEYVGEDRYTVEHVLGPRGTRLLEQRAADTWNSARLVSDLRATDAAFVGASIIKAAEATTRIVPVPSGNGIGGPVKGYLITSTSIVPLPGR